ncbi:MAG TPA: DUF4328 domain-containing protein [Solirubrobacterales bacterium]|nr:DUF4328 domain-containing protein [Solirubrobacterales bacterium]
MDSAGSPVGYGSHRVADPGDQPRELSGLAWGVFVSFGLLAILSVVKIVVALKLRSAATGGGDIVGAYHTYSSWAGIFGFAILLGAGVFIAWFFRAYRNLRRLGVQNMRYGNGWAIGAWFIPIFGMIRPKQIANDVWRGSEPGVEVSSGWRQVDVPSLVHWWWALFLIQSTLVYVGDRIAGSGYDDLHSLATLESGLSQIKSGTVIAIAGQLVAIAAVVLAIKVVSQVTERLDGIRHGVLSAAAVDPSAPPAMVPPTSFPPPGQ